MRRRRLLYASSVLGLGIALAVVGGLPDPGRSVDLLTGSVTSATESAFIVLLCWLVVVCLAIPGVLSLFPATRLRRPRALARSLAVLAVGLTLLGMGIVRNQAGYRVCCSDSTTAQEAEHLVH